LSYNSILRIGTAALQTATRTHAFSQSSVLTTSLGPVSVHIAKSLIVMSMRGGAARADDVDGTSSGTVAACSLPFIELYIFEDDSIAGRGCRVGPVNVDVE
jgi:hypothetical protein